MIFGVRPVSFGHSLRTNSVGTPRRVHLDLYSRRPLRFHRELRVITVLGDRREENAEVTRYGNNDRPPPPIFHWV